MGILRRINTSNLITSFVLTTMVTLTGCGGSGSKEEPARQSNADSKIVLIGSWTDREKSRFLEITEGGSIVIHKKGATDEDIGFFEIEQNNIKIYKDKNTAAGRTEIARFEILSDNEIVFGENQEYWNVVNVSGRWFREGFDPNKIVEKREFKQLTPEEQNLVDVKKKLEKCEELVKKLETDRKSYLIKISKLDEEKEKDSWRLNAKMLATTKNRLRDANSELKKLKRAKEALEILVADKKRLTDMKKAGLDEEGIADLLRSIKETETQLSDDGDSTDFELRNLIEDELKSLEDDSSNGADGDDRKKG